MLKTKVLVIVLVLAAAGGAIYWQHRPAAKPAAKAAAAAPAASHKAASAPPLNHCADSTDSQKVIVSLGQQHMWGCSGTSQVYDTAVTTGATAYGDGTPTGTWQIQGKQTNRYLTGSDSRGSWNDFVKYWIPYNGDLGFHDASWQTFALGDLTKYQTGGSHGCVHMSEAAMKWLYDWAPVGTAVTIQS